MLVLIHKLNLIPWTNYVVMVIVSQVIQATSLDLLIDVFMVILLKIIMKGMFMWMNLWEEHKFSKKAMTMKHT